MWLLQLFVSILLIFGWRFVLCLHPLLDLIAPRIDTIRYTDPEINTKISAADHFYLKISFLGLKENLALSYNFRIENYEVQTEDGYLLTLNHLLHPNRTHQKSAGVVLLQHGVLSSSDTWLLRGPDNDLAYLLATNGFDVWLNNCRGNVYSRKHRFLKTSDPRFWDFSFHEIGYYDIAAVIDFILRRTGSKSLNYIGHSMGSTVLYVLLSSRPEYNRKIRLGITLAPVVYYRSSGDPLLRIAVQMAPKIAIMLKLMNRYELFPRRKPTVDFLKNFCLSSQAAHDFCTNVYYALFGQGGSFFNQSLIPIVLTYYPAGVSVDTLLHFAQNINRGSFRQTNYGLRENYRRYKQGHPPDYRIDNIAAPLALYYGNRDTLAVPQDVEYLSKKLKNLRGLYRVPYDDFNHGDFIWGGNGTKILYKHIIRLIMKS